MPEARITTVTSLYIASAFISIPLSPLLDWRLSRRSYAIAFAILSALCTFGSLVAIGNVPLLAVVLFLWGISVVMCLNAVGGWFGCSTGARSLRRRRPR